jgi:hypothetical protein
VIGVVTDKDQPLVRIKGLHKSFGSVKVLELLDRVGLSDPRERVSRSTLGWAATAHAVRQWSSRRMGS